MLGMDMPMFLNKARSGQKLTVWLKLPTVCGPELAWYRFGAGHSATSKQGLSF